MPHGHCYLFETKVMWLNIIADALITLAYLTIPLTLIYIAKKRKDLPFDWIFAGFGIFILACGATHALEVWTIWDPVYRLTGATKAVTALASIATAILLVRLIPQLLAIPNVSALRESNAALAKEIAERQRTEQLLRMAGRIGRLGAWSVEIPSYVQVWSDEVCAIYGIPAGTVLSVQECIDSYTPTSNEMIGKAFTTCVRDGTPYDVELEMVKPDDRIQWVRAIGEVERDAAGQICRVQGALQDISLQKHSELALQKSEARYHSLFEHMLEGYAYCQLLYQDGQATDYIYLEVNGAFERQTGLKDVAGKKVSDVVPGMHVANPEQLVRYSRVAATGQAEQFETHAQAIDIWFSVSVYSHEKEHFVVVFENINVRKKAEAALVQQQTELRVLFDLVPAMIWFKDTRNGFLRVNQRVAEATGLLIGQIEGKTAEEIFPQEAAAYYADDMEVIHSGKPKIGIVEKLQGPNGQELWVQTDKVPYCDVDGQVIGLVALVYDITTRLQDERRLAASEALLRECIQHTPAAIAMMDTGMRYLQASDRWLKDYHLENREIIGHSHYEIFPDIPQRWKDIHQRVLAGGVESCDEDPFPRADGGMEWLQWEARPWRQPDSAIGGLVFYTQVITARKEAEAERDDLNKKLVDASRLAGMAEIATNVLHNVGNVLNSVNISATIAADTIRRSCAVDVTRIAGLLQEHRGDLPKFLASMQGSQLPDFLTSLGQRLGDEQQTVLAELHSLGTHIEHIKEIVDMQQTYARRVGISELLSVGNLVEEALRLNAASFDRHGIEVVRDFAEAPLIEVDKHKALQILTNLIRNAKDAMDDPGAAGRQMTVRISSDGAEVVQISVADQGIGIASENLTRIFNNGFTTRKEGHGFGLHSAALAATEMGGTLTAHSAGPGAGAVFTLSLPFGAAK